MGLGLPVIIYFLLKSDFMSLRTMIRFNGILLSASKLEIEIGQLDERRLSFNVVYLPIGFFEGVKQA